MRHERPRSAIQQPEPSDFVLALGKPQVRQPLTGTGRTYLLTDVLCADL